jgi:uncharacterized protein YoxC
MLLLIVYIIRFIKLFTIMLHEKKQISISPIDRFSITATKWIGSTDSLVVHTVIFVIAFLLVLLGIPFERVLLVLTTIVSLEAIYLSIFIQMSVNRTTRKLRAVSKDIEEIQADVEGISEDVEEIQKDVEEISEDVEGIEKDVDELQKDVEEISEDVEELSEDEEEEEKKEAQERKDDLARLNRIEETLESLLGEIKTQKETSNKKSTSVKEKNNPAY